jgi:hypothetical protein
MGSPRSALLSSVAIFPQAVFLFPCEKRKSEGARADQLGSCSVDGCDRHLEISVSPRQSGLVERRLIS